MQSPILTVHSRLAGIYVQLTPKVEVSKRYNVLWGDFNLLVAAHRLPQYQYGIDITLSIREVTWQLVSLVILAITTKCFPK